LHTTDQTFAKQMKNYPEFYKQLGNLLFSISAVDGSIAPRELKELRRIVKEDLVPVEQHEDDFGSDAAFAVEFQFDFLEGNGISTEEAWEQVAEYLRNNSHLLPEKDKKLLSSSAKRVAEAFHGINQYEHKLLTHLDKMLGN